MGEHAMKHRSEVIPVRLLTDSELDNLTNSMGAGLMAAGYAPRVHTRKLLRYELEGLSGRPKYVGLFAPLGWFAPGVAVPAGGRKARKTAVVVQVTDLPFTFSVEPDRGIDVPVGHAFGISAPGEVFGPLAALLAPYREELEAMKRDACRVLEGVSFVKKVPGVACDHCGFVQEVPIRITVERVDGHTAYGPGGSCTVACSNPACGQTFPVSWDGIVFKIDVT